MSAVLTLVLVLFFGVAQAQTDMPSAGELYKQFMDKQEEMIKLQEEIAARPDPHGINGLLLELEKWRQNEQIAEEMEEFLESSALLYQYELPDPDESSLVGRIARLVKAVNNLIDLVNKLYELPGRVDSVETRIVSVETRMASIDERISVLETNLGEMRSDIAAIKEAVGAGN